MTLRDVMDITLQSTLSVVLPGVVYDLYEYKVYKHEAHNLCLLGVLGVARLNHLWDNFSVGKV